MMRIQKNDVHQRVIHAAIDRHQLDWLILEAVAKELKIPVEELKKHARVEIEDNMEGSPQYRSGHKATVRATIPLDTPGEREP